MHMLALSTLYSHTVWRSHVALWRKEIAANRNKNRSLECVWSDALK
jgi:hypothetical protein